MSKKTVSLIVIVIGFLFAIVSLVADYIWVGSYPGINSAQIAGIVGGILAALIGFVFLRLANKKKE
ncbi:MAG TPA: hypothetical protein PLE10_03665 [Brevefilum sp.]|nr:hypothetical protein [Brevefilum sp.]HOR18911.1 hypothetical protein [Brevefilum sp.]HPL70008.1 hypothetical protein [Brevefilum sp.]